MNKHASHSAEDILGIPIDQPEELFPNTVELARKKRLDLIKAWHPDSCSHKDAEKVYNYIQKLFESALQRIETGSWISPGYLSVVPKESSLIFGNSKNRNIRYLRKRDFEAGNVLYSEKTATYILNNEASDLFESSIDLVKNLRYKDSKMQKEFSKYLPSIVDSFSTKDNKNVVILSKSEDYFLLHDLLDFFGGKLDPKHVAWIISSLYNILCYFYVSDLCHNALSLENCFISPKNHSVAILGGWWYAKNKGEKMVALPSRTVSLCPKGIVAEKKASHCVDLHLIKALGRELLGDISGNSLLYNKDMPKPMISFLLDKIQENAIQEYNTWSQKVLIDSFGKKRFTKMDIDNKEIYKE